MPDSAATVGSGGGTGGGAAALVDSAPLILMDATDAAVSLAAGFTDADTAIDGKNSTEEGTATPTSGFRRY